MSKHRSQNKFEKKVRREIKYMGRTLFVILMSYLLTAINLIAAVVWYELKYRRFEPYFLLFALIMIGMVFVSIYDKKNRTKIIVIICSFMHFLFCLGLCFLVSPFWALIWLVEAAAVYAAVKLYFEKKKRHQHRYKQNHTHTGEEAEKEKEKAKE